MANFRSPKLLRYAREIPNCTGCGAHNRGQVVAAHADWQEYGKGTGIKAHDFAIAYLCDTCHAYLHGKDGTKADKKEFFRMADIRTREWLFNAGKLRVV